MPEAMLDKSMQRTPNLEEKKKPFKLVKYFTFSSLTFIFIVTLLLSILNTHWARSMEFKKSEDYALVLIENLNHQLFVQFLIPTALKYGKIQLREKEQFDRMDQVVRNTFHSFSVETINIYDMNNTISYSFDKEMVGLKDFGGLAYKNALEGKTTHQLQQQGHFIERVFGFTRNCRIITHAPLRAEWPVSRISGPVLGVVEVSQDLSDEYQTIYRFQIRVIWIITAVMICLFLVLLFVVKRGEGIIEQRAAEQIALKEQLSRARHLSTLGEMVATVSHEIRNPLGIIKSSAELLKKKTATSESSYGIPDIIVEEAGRLNRIITDFLNFARPKEPDLHLCRVEDVLEKSVLLFSADANEERYPIQIQTAGDPPMVPLDKDMMHQAFLNILINSKQAMPRGGKIEIRLCADNHWATISFKDQGGGIPGEIQSKIWDPFFTTKDKGTGLGLGIVKNIVEAHEGRVRLENAAEGGARVIVDLPIRQET